MLANDEVVYGNTTLPQGIRSRFIPNVNGLTTHILESGFEEQNRPCVLLLHGFPEMAYSWRKQMLPLAQAGFHVVAPDLRGYGRTSGWDNRYDGDVGSFRLFNIVKDTLALVYALGYKSVSAVVGHDFGSPVAAYCALIRPDVFRSVVLMSGPFAGAPSISAGQLSASSTAAHIGIDQALEQLNAPRKHYRWYYSQRDANTQMCSASQGIADFLRAYYHVKSAAWPYNNPQPLKSWRPEELAKLPTYYVMDLGKSMPETVAEFMPSVSEVDACAWLTNTELSVYVDEYTRTGFQGGLQWYRCGTDRTFSEDLSLFANLVIDVPSMFIAGSSDWGIYQSPNAFERMQSHACSKLQGVHIVDGAGHWIQQEQSEKTNELLVEFLDANL